MENVKRILAVVLGLIILTALICVPLIKTDTTPGTSGPAAVIHYSGGSNLTLLGSVSVHNAGATGGSFLGGGSK